MNPMFDEPLLATVNALILVGILLAVIALPVLKRETRKLHEKNLALRRSQNDEGF